MRKPLQTIRSRNLAGLAGDVRVALSRLKHRLREQSYVGDFTNSQKSVLLRLDRDGPATVSMLARAEGVRPQSMRTTVAALEAAGVIGGKPDPHDARKTFISLTPKFAETVRSGRMATEDWLFRAIDSELSAHEQEELAAAVRLLAKLADYDIKAKESDK